MIYLLYLFFFEKRKMTIVTIFGKQEKDGKILYLGKWDGWQNKFSWLEATHAQITNAKIADYESKGTALTYDDRSVKPKKAFQHALQKPFDYDKELKKNLNLTTMELIVDGTKYVFYKMPKMLTLYFNANVSFNSKC